MQNELIRERSHRSHEPPLSVQVLTCLSNYRSNDPVLILVLQLIRMHLNYCSIDYSFQVNFVCAKMYLGPLVLYVPGSLSQANQRELLHMHALNN